MDRSAEVLKLIQFYFPDIYYKTNPVKQISPSVFRRMEKTRLKERYLRNGSSKENINAKIYCLKIRTEIIMISY